MIKTHASKSNSMIILIILILLDLLTIVGVTECHYLPPQVRRDDRQEFHVDSSGEGSITNVYLSGVQMMTQGSAFHSQSQSVKSDTMMAAMMMLIMQDLDGSSEKMPLFMAAMMAGDSDAIMMIPLMMRFFSEPKSSLPASTTTTLSSDMRTTSAVSIVTSTVPPHICRMCGEEKGSSISKVRMIIV